MRKKSILFLMLCSLFSFEGYSEIQWNLPASTIYSQEGGEALSPQIALNPSEFKAGLIWSSVQDEEYQVWGSSFDGTDWSAPEAIGSSLARVSPRLEMDGEGKAMAVWDSYDGASLFLHCGLFDGAHWTSLLLQNLGMGYYPSLPNLSLNQAGYAAVTWQNRSRELVGLTYNAPVQSWTPSPYPVSQPGIPLDSTLGVPSPLFLDSNQLLLSAVLEPDRICYTSLDALNPPSSVVNTMLQMYGVESAAPRLSFSTGKKNAIFLVQDARKNHFVVSGSFYNSAPSFFLVAATPGSPVHNMEVFLSPDNDRGGAIWQRDIAGYNVIEGSYLTQRVSWDALRQPASTSGYSPSVSVYNTSASSLLPIYQLIAVWVEKSGGEGNYRVVASEYDRSSHTWSTPQPLSAPAGLIDFPRIVTDSVGNAIVVWTRLDETAEPPRAVVEAVVGEPNRTKLH